jgi:hypothetical protein
MAAKITMSTVDCRAWLSLLSMPLGSAASFCSGANRHDAGLYSALAHLRQDGLEAMHAAREAVHDAGGVPNRVSRSIQH